MRGKGSRVGQLHRRVGKAGRRRLEQEAELWGGGGVSKTGKRLERSKRVSADQIRSSQAQRQSQMLGRLNCLSSYEHDQVGTVATG